MVDATGDIDSLNPGLIAYTPPGCKIFAKANGRAATALNTQRALPKQTDRSIVSHTQSGMRSPQFLETQIGDRRIADTQLAEVRQSRNKLHPVVRHFGTVQPQRPKLGQIHKVPESVVVDIGS